MTVPIRLQVPIPISEKQRLVLAMRFLRATTYRGDKQVRMWERLARECIAAANHQVRHFQLNIAHTKFYTMYIRT